MPLNIFAATSENLFALAAAISSVLKGRRVKTAHTKLEKEEKGTKGKSGCGKEKMRKGERRTEGKEEKCEQKSKSEGKEGISLPTRFKDITAMHWRKQGLTQLAETLSLLNSSFKRQLQIMSQWVGLPHAPPWPQCPPALLPQVL